MCSHILLHDILIEIDLKNSRNRHVMIKGCCYVDADMTTHERIHCLPFASSSLTSAFCT